MYDVITEQLNISTGEAVEAALKNLLEMLRLCRGDNMGIRSPNPALYLRLGRDQDAFYFFKWYANVPNDFDWKNPEVPTLDVKGADPLEPLDIKSGILGTDLSFKVTLLQLKSRLFVDVSMLEGIAQKMGNKGLADKMELVKEMVMTETLLYRRDIVDTTDYMPIMANLRQQMVANYKNIQEHNKLLIPALEDPTR